MSHLDCSRLGFALAKSESRDRVCPCVLCSPSFGMLGFGSLAVSLPSREKILPKAVTRVTRGKLGLPWEEGREKGVLTVNFLTPDGSVVLRNCDRYFLKGSSSDFDSLYGLSIPSRFCWVLWLEQVSVQEVTNHGTCLLKRKR